jgi:hypothetical protein
MEKMREELYRIREFFQIKIALPKAREILNSAILE